MSTTPVGTCSLCGGRVSLPTFYHSVVPPVPQCDSCGAIAASHGPIIPMRPFPQVQTRTTTTVIFDHD